MQQKVQQVVVAVRAIVWTIAIEIVKVLVEAHVKVVVRVDAVILVLLAVMEVVKVPHQDNLNTQKVGSLFWGTWWCRKDYVLMLNRPQPLVINTDAAVNWGLSNTFSKAEFDDTATPTNVNVYYIHDKRLSRGLEINLSIGYIPYYLRPFWLFQKQAD